MFILCLSWPLKTVGKPSAACFEVMIAAHVGTANSFKNKKRLFFEGEIIII